jgi:putative DNA primase/helicase
MNSRFIYQAERPFPNFDEVPALTDDEGRTLLDLAEMFRWRVPASAAMLAGWCLLAPLCGAINWRSHVWVTGGAGSGKSTIMERYVHPLMAAIDVYAQGNSTEAGIRQAVGGDAVPVLFDESEQNDEGETKRMQAVLALVRQASSESGARTLKGTVAGKGMHFHVRSMFCLASIQVGIQHQADRERLTVLALRDKEHGNAGQNQGDRWEEIKAALYQIERDPTFPRRLVRRSIEMLPTILAAVDVFVRVAAQHFGNQRTGDQYGTLLAGAWCLLNAVAPTDAEAQDWINQYDWQEYTDPAKVDESEMALRALLDAKVRTPNGAELTVYDVVAQAARFTGIHANDNGDDLPNLENAHLSLESANQLLARHGMRVKEGSLMLSNNSAALVSLVRNTKYAADLRGVLSRLDGVTKSAGTVRINGTNSRCLLIPLRMIL